MKLACLGAVALFVLAGVASLTISVLFDQQGMMVGCPYMEHGAAVCPMTVADHVGTWRQLFGTFEPRGVAQAAVTLLGVLAGVAFVVIQSFRTERSPGVPFERYRYDRPEVALFVPLRVVFARGILNPRNFPAAA